ncbi:MAG: LysR family transcriptional regulator [Clostridiales bacterium]|nr:LysR family transcriptional regulator [Clostridiales bacterium]
MTLLEYRIFYTVTQQGSFARAAQALHLTPSAISHAVSSMEEACGFALFVRGKGGVSLTRSGEALYPVIRQVLSADDALTQIVDELKGVQRGTVRIGAFNSVCMSWLPQIVTSYKRKFPGVDIEIHQGTYDDVIAWIKTGAVDLGFLSTKSTRELSVHPLYRDRLMCVVPKGFRTLNPGYVTPEELRHETFVIQGDATDADIQAFLAKHHFAVRASCRVVDDLSTIAMVESGFGICILPSLILERAHGNVDAYPIEPMEYREFGIAVQNPQMLAPAVRQMAAHIEAFAREKRAENPQTNAGFTPGDGF